MGEPKRLNGLRIEIKLCGDMSGPVMFELCIPDS